MRQSGQENPIGREIDGPQLHVSLKEETVRIQRNFEHLRQFLIFIRDNGACQNNEVRFESDLFTQDLVFHFQMEKMIFHPEVGFRIEIVRDKGDSLLPGFRIKPLH
jgi:hypothetical protein